MLLEGVLSMKLDSDCCQNQRLGVCVCGGGVPRLPGLGEVGTTEQNMAHDPNYHGGKVW